MSLKIFRIVLTPHMSLIVYLQKQLKESKIREVITRLEVKELYKNIY